MNTIHSSSHTLSPRASIGRAGKPVSFQLCFGFADALVERADSRGHCKSLFVKVSLKLVSYVHFENLQSVVQCLVAENSRRAASTSKIQAHIVTEDGTILTEVVTMI